MISTETHGQLACLNWQTLSDQRAASVRPDNGIYRTAFIVTGACNFACPYCKTLGGSRAPTMVREEALSLLDALANQGLKELRVSGGEPTVVPWLPDLVARAMSLGVAVSISSNGYADLEVYKALVDAGASTFSISLDTPDPAKADLMAGGRLEVLARVTRTIRYLSNRNVAVYIGMVCCGSRENAQTIREVLLAVADMGVTDVKVMPPVQEGDVIDGTWLPEGLAERFPFLSWRAHNFSCGTGVRGLKATDCTKCALVLDDATIAGGKHYPCNVYFREGGEAIGTVGPNMMAERAQWYASHNSFQDPVCRSMCMDLLRVYNNRVQELAG